MKIITETRVRYPDVTVACGPQDEGGDPVRPTVVFEVLSPSTSLTDLRVKPVEYRGVTSILAYVIVSQDEPELVVFRRSNGWEPETISGRQAILPLPEIDLELPLIELYR